MSRAATSVFIHGLYSAGLSVLLLLTPAFLFGWIGLPTQRGMWAYAVALALAVLAYLDLAAARADAAAYCWLAILQRCAVSIALEALVYLRLAQAPVMALVLPEALTAAWTLAALIMDGRVAAEEGRRNAAALAATAPEPVAAR